MVYKFMSEELRTEVAVYLLEKSANGKLEHGDILKTTARFNLRKRNMSNIWKLPKKPRLVGEKLNVKSKRVGNTNKKKVLPNVEHIKSLIAAKRNTIKRVSENCGVSVGKVHSWVKECLLKPHSSPLHPNVSDLHKDERLLHSLKMFVVNQVIHDFLDLNAMPETEIIFSEMSNTIHMDEKWFFITDDDQKIYVVNGEELPYRSCQSKRYITKVMFMCAISRPVYARNGDLIFDGKTEMFPLKQQVPAAINSRNKPRETMETKPIDSITKEVVKKRSKNIVE